MKEKIFRLINEQRPFKEGKKTALYEYDGLIVKVFYYHNFLQKIFLLRGLKSYYISKILNKKGINIPEAKFYYSKKSVEVFVYRKIQGEEILKVLKNKAENSEILIEKLKNFIKELFRHGIYHSDFDPTNIIVDESGNLYLIDLENVSFILTKKRKLKMVKKINKFFSRDLNLSIDFSKVI